MDLVADQGIRPSGHRGQHHAAGARGHGCRLPVRRCHAASTAALSLRDAERSLDKTIRVGESTFTVVAWPGDRAWLGFVTTTIPKAIPQLEKLTGQTWPETATTVTQDAGLGVVGYAGTFDGEPEAGGDSSAIALSEQLDTNTLSHELAHAWSSGATIDERWLSEGLAEWLAGRTAQALDSPKATWRSVSPDESKAFPLAEWGYSGPIHGWRTKTRNPGGPVADAAGPGRPLVGEGAPKTTVCRAPAWGRGIPCDGRPPREKRRGLGLFGGAIRRRR